MKNEIIKLIKDEIDEQLRIRSIFVETNLVLEKNKMGDFNFKLTSTKFNTVPVIHSEIEIINFGSSVKRGECKQADGTSVPTTYFNISVAASYEGNSAGLFSVEGQVQDRHEDTVFFSSLKSQRNIYRD